MCVLKLTSFSFPRNSKQTATLFTACAKIERKNTDKKTLNEYYQNVLS